MNAPSTRADIYDATVICTVRGIQSGQLALRPEPNGSPFAGLNNGNVVRAVGGTLDANGTVWEDVIVIDGPNSQVEGRRGYVNGNYLSCKWYDEQGNLIRED
ncbi:MULTISPECIES: hypothetical protein [Spirulina sp. CCY15215]|uniref:hypothetical protein n=1 Tax=Spirulina sp. CCY15215 TaxID=2767591 RepID=UPI00194ED4BE|nr:hypothetical protein [Spirulina major]